MSALRVLQSGRTLLATVALSASIPMLGLPADAKAASRAVGGGDQAASGSRIYSTVRAHPSGNSNAATRAKRRGSQHPETYSFPPTAASRLANELFAANRRATGGAAWDKVAAIHSTGQVISGGEPGSFDLVADLRTGFSRMLVSNGGLLDDSGFDGEIWDRQNGIVTVADLPSLLQDARSEAFASRNGWWATSAGAGWTADRARVRRAFDVVTVMPFEGSSIQVWLNRRTHLIARLLFDTDAGPVSSAFSDWREVAGVKIPFRRVDTDATLQITTMIVRTATVERVLQPGALVRPSAVSHRSDVGAAPVVVPFVYTGFDRGHVVVPARMGGKPVNVIFDSGGANYIAPPAASRLGLRTGGGINIGGVGTSSVSGGFADVREISVGRAGLRNQSVIVGPLPYPALHPRAGLSIDGLIGFEFLSEYRTTFDYEHRTVAFASFDAPKVGVGVTLPFQSDGHSIYVAATVEGVPGLFRLDTETAGRSPSSARSLLATGCSDMAGSPPSARAASAVPSRQASSKRTMWASQEKISAMSLSS